MILSGLWMWKDHLLRDLFRKDRSSTALHQPVRKDVLSGFKYDYCSFPFDRATSVPVPARISGRQRNLSSSGLSFPSSASAMISPSTGANLNPCPLSQIGRASCRERV